MLKLTFRSFSGLISKLLPPVHMWYCIYMPNLVHFASIFKLPNSTEFVMQFFTKIFTNYKSGHCWAEANFLFSITQWAVVIWLRFSTVLFQQSYLPWLCCCCCSGSDVPQEHEVDPLTRCCPSSSRFHCQRVLIKIRSYSPEQGTRWLLKLPRCSPTL